jgi:plasmid maintenance system killer protein
LATFLLFTLLSLSVQANNCLLTEALKNPALSGNSEFWADLSRISGTGKPSDQQIKSLVEKHGGSLAKVTAAPPPVATKSGVYSIANKAEKEIKGLPKNLKVELDEFLEIAIRPNGLHEIRNNPGRWHLEKVEQYGKNARTVRLNGGYRILFDVTPEGVEVRRVNKGQIHGG